MQPTGRLHLGNLVGALENWVALQNEGYENFHMVADWHALTVNPEAATSLDSETLEVIIDWLSAGIDPKRSVLFVQSQVKEHAELHLLLSMLITVPRLERNPTLKERITELHLDTNISYGHLGYPVLQAADILIYRPQYVPVGQDQMPHIELSREIARRFNKTYKKVFPVPEGKVTTFSRLPGLDGQKMSKSLGNTILMSDTPEAVSSKVRSMITDPQKIYRNDPGRPDICPVYAYHRKFNPEEEPQIREDCETGRLGCVDCKANLASKLNAYLDPLRERHSKYEKEKDRVREVVAEGVRVAREEAQLTMAQVYEAMRFGAPVGV